jgi:hypothetical protein
MAADGSLAGDGERMTAFRGGANATAWTSFDGLSWEPISVAGASPRDQLVLRTVAMPLGLLVLDQNGSAWFGEPAR